jgi:hypothetical protein
VRVDALAEEGNGAEGEADPESAPPDDSPTIQ